MIEREAPSREAMRLFSAGKFEAAHSVLMQGLLSCPEDKEIALALALTLGKLGRLKECLQQWQYLKLRHPSLYIGGKYHHAEALIEAGAFDEAETLLKEQDDRSGNLGRRQELIDLLLERIADASLNANPDTASSPARLHSARSLKAGAASIVDSNEDMRTEYRTLVQNAPVKSADLSFESIIIVTYGRTGSTLLQGILNSISGVCVLGENEGAFYHLFEFFQATSRLSEMKRTELPSSPFFGAGSIDPAASLIQVKKTVAEFFSPFSADPAVSCIGFKEVRFKDHPDTLQAYLEFLEAVFPKPAFLFLWRDHDRVLRSGWWKAEDRLAAGDILSQVEDSARLFASGRDNCFELDYLDLAVDSPKLAGLFSFLGAPFDEERLARVLRIPHSYDPESPEIQELFRNVGKLR